MNVVILIFCGISSVLSAPVEENQLYNIVVNDSRTENLRKYPFVAECKEINSFSKSLCFAMFDVALSYYNQKIDFSTNNATYKEGNFCTSLTQVLPEKPANTDSSKAFDHLARWFKDTLAKEDGEKYCKENCFFKDPYSYNKVLLPVCQFLMNQYSVLLNQNSTPVSDEVAKSDEFKSEFHSGLIQSNLDQLTFFITFLASDVNKESEMMVSPVIIVPAAAVEKHVSTSNISSESSPKESPEKLNNETMTKQESPTVAQNEKEMKNVQGEKTQDVNISEALSKPIAQTTTSSVKKPETTKTEVVVKSEEPSKSDEPINLDNADDNQLFDGDQLDSIDKDGDMKPDNNYAGLDQEDDEYGEDIVSRNNNKANENKLPQEPEPTVEEEVPRKKIEVVNFQEDPDSNFFAYLCGLMFLCVLLYILHQNRHKILACILEGRRGNRRGRERSRGGSKAAYSKLDCNLEEAITSKKSLNGKSMDIIY